MCQKNWIYNVTHNRASKYVSKDYTSNRSLSFAYSRENHTICRGKTPSYLVWQKLKQAASPWRLMSNSWAALRCAHIERASQIDWIIPIENRKISSKWRTNALLSTGAGLLDFQQEAVSSRFTIRKAFLKTRSRRTWFCVLSGGLGRHLQQAESRCVLTPALLAGILPNSVWPALYWVQYNHWFQRHIKFHSLGCKFDSY